MIKFIQLYSVEAGNYTEERREKLMEITREEIQKYLSEEE